MPLLRQNVFLLEATPEELAADEMVFQVRFTKEIFRNYEEYVKRMDMYRQKIWTCKATGRENLTYEKALVSEFRAAQKAEFPKDFMGPVLHLVQFSELGIDELVDSIYATLSDTFVVGEELTSVKGDTIFRCKVLEVLNHATITRDAEGTTMEDAKTGTTYQVGWLDGNGQVAEVTTENAKNLTKRTLPFSKAALRKFILESAYGEATLDVPWLVRDKLVRKFKIPCEPPCEERQVHARQDPNQRQVNQAFFDETLDEIEAEYAMRKRNSKRSRDSRSWKPRKDRKSDGCSSPDPSLDLPDDNTIETSSEDGPRPVPSSDFKVEQDCVGSLLMVWDFCNSFAKMLRLSQFSLHDFERAVSYSESEPSLLSEAYFALFRVVLGEQGAKQRFAQRRKKKVQLCIETWKSDLCDYLELEGPENIKEHLESLRENYWLLPAAAKLEVFEELVDRAVNTASIRGQLDENMEEFEALSTRKRDYGLPISKRKGSRYGDGGKSRDDSSENGDTMVATEEVVCSHENGCLIGWLRKGKRKPVGLNGVAPPVKREYSARCLFFNSSRQMIFTCNRVQLRDDGEKSEESEMLLQKKMEQVDRDVEKCFLRSSPLGRDRSYNRYWFFHREGRVFVESEDSKSWGFYSGKQELDDLRSSLNPKGAREYALKEQLENAYARITASMQKRSKDLSQRLALEEANIRRSLRVQSAPRPTGFLAYVNKSRNAS